MMDSIRMNLVLATLFNSLICIVCANDCINPGILVDIHYREVSGKADFFRYGLSIGLGTPLQRASLWPAITHNDTAFSAVDYCSISSPQSCQEEARGFFSANNSATWKNDLSVQSLDSTPADSRTSVLPGKDTLTILKTTAYSGPQTPVAVDEFPALVLSNFTSLTSSSPFGPGGTLGLGRSSTLLQRLVDSGMIAARSFGIYLGSRVNQPGDAWSGSLVLGGYDSGRFQQPVKIYDQVPASVDSAQSPFQIGVEQVSLVTSTGTTNLLDIPFNAYLSTDQNPIQFPPLVTRELQTMLGAKRNETTGTLQLLNSFDGNLTITLGDGLNITFDSSWLADDSLITPISSAPLSDGFPFRGFRPHGDDVPLVFGASFLLRAYLFVNHDADPPSFGLAQALPAATHIRQEPFCPDVVPLAASPAVTDHYNRPSRAGLIGGLCGGLLGGLALIALLWFLFIRKKIHKKYNLTNSPSTTPSQFLWTFSKKSFQQWRTKAQKFAGSAGTNKQPGHMYTDVETGLGKKPHIAAYMFSPYDSETEQPFSPSKKTSYEAYRSMSPPVRAYKATENEKELLSTRKDSETTVVPFTTLIYTSKSIDSTNSSMDSTPIVATMKSPTPMSNYNRHQRNGSLPQHKKQGSKSSIQPITTDMNHLPVAGKSVNPEEAARKHVSYEKSLPATPALSTPVSPSPVLSRPIYDQLRSKSVAPKVPRIPSTVMDLITRKTNMLALPSMKRSMGLPSRTPEGSHDVSKSSTQRPQSFWRSKRERLNLTHNTERSNTKARPAPKDDQKHTRPAITDTTAQKSRHGRRPLLPSTSSRSPAAMATRISLLKELRKPANREAASGEHIADKPLPKPKPEADEEADREPPSDIDIDTDTDTDINGSNTNNTSAHGIVHPGDKAEQTESGSIHDTSRHHRNHSNSSNNHKTNHPIPIDPITPLSTRAPSAISPCTSAGNLEIRYSTVSSTSQSDHAVSPISATDEHPPHHHHHHHHHSHHHNSHGHHHTQRTIHAPPLPPMPRLSTLPKIQVRSNMN